MVFWFRIGECQAERAENNGLRFAASVGRTCGEGETPRPSDRSFHSWSPQIKSTIGPDLVGMTGNPGRRAMNDRKHFIEVMTP